MSSERAYYFYLLASDSRVLYAGVTNDLQRRVWEHKQERVPGFSARYNVKNLVYVEVYGDIRAAIRREKQVKGWLREKKIALIQSANPHWRELGADWPGAPTAPRGSGKRDSSLRSG